MSTVALSPQLILKGNPDDLQYINKEFFIGEKIQLGRSNEMIIRYKGLIGHLGIIVKIFKNMPKTIYSIYIDNNIISLHEESLLKFLDSRQEDSLFLIGTSVIITSHNGYVPPCIGLLGKITKTPEKEEKTYTVHLSSNEIFDFYPSNLFE